MKYLFKEGSFKENDGKKVLKFESGDAAADIYFDKSIYEISSALSAYDFGKLEGTNYYYIFQKYGQSKKDPLEVEESIKKILSGDWEDIVNWETITLGIPDESIENDVFWDVNNNIIIVKGEKNLRQISIELAWIGYERLGVKNRTPELEEELILSRDIPLITRTKVNEK